MSGFSGSPPNPVFVPDQTTATPFSAVTVSDPPGTLETVTVTLSLGWLPYQVSQTNLGSLSDPMGGGSFNSSTDTFTEQVLSTGTPTGATQILQRLVYTPPSLSNGLSANIYASVSVNGVADPTGPALLDILTPPAITGPASTFDPDAQPVKPFNGIQIEDENFGAQASATIYLTDGGAPTDADGLLSGTGIQYVSPGTYQIAATDYYTLQYELSKIVFDPNPVAPGEPVRTTVLGLSITDDTASGLTSSFNTSVQVPPPGSGEIVISGTHPTQIQAGNTVEALSGVTVFDNNTNAMDSATLTITGGGRLSGGGLTSTGANSYSISAVPPAELSTILQSLTFTPPTLSGSNPHTSTIALNVTDGALPSVADSGTVVTEEPNKPPPSYFTISDQTTGQTLPEDGQAYIGPLPNIARELVEITPDSLVIGSTTPNVFIYAGGANQNIYLANNTGNNWLEGSAGNDMLTGGKGNNTYAVDDVNTNASSDLWNTINGFHAGDTAVIWGLQATGFNYLWSIAAGTPGYTGLTLESWAPGKPYAFVTLAGYSMADMSNGRLSSNFVNDGVNTPYLVIQGH